MARVSKRISELTDGAAPQASDYAPFARGSSDVKISWAAMVGAVTTSLALGTMASQDASAYYTKVAADARFAPIAVPWASLTGKPTTLAGYGITDAYTKTASDALYLPLAGTAANSSQLLGGTWAVPGAIGATTTNTAAFTTVTASSTGQFNGLVGVGAAAQSDNSLLVGPPSGSSSVNKTSVWVNTTASSTTTTRYAGFASTIATAAAAFTLTDVIHYAAFSGSKGAGSTITNVKGFAALSAIAVGTNNYSFYTDLADAGAATQWAFYNASTAPVLAGPRLFIGTSAAYGLGYRIRLQAGGGGANLMSGANQYMFAAHFDNFQADCTGEGVVYYANIGTAGGIALTDLKGVYMSTLTLSTGTITNVYGMYVHANFLKSATNNFSYYTNANDGSGTFAFYSAGSASSRFTGSVGIGNVANNVGTALNVSVTSTMTGASITPVNHAFTAPVTAVTAMSGIFGAYATAAAAFTCAEINAFRVNQFTLGAGSALTNLNGFYVNSLFTNDVAGTTVRGFYSLLNKGTNATVWQLYMGGTAPSLFGGALIEKEITETYSASITPDASLGNERIITVTNTTAFTINAPTNPSTGQYLEITVRNTSGSAMGAITWNAVFKMTAFTNPATGFSRTIIFRYNGASWVEKGRTAADVPN